jgi:hypothetical protein
MDSGAAGGASLVMISSSTGSLRSAELYCASEDINSGVSNAWVIE